MRMIPARFIADDDTEHPTKEACLAHEAALPYVKLIAEVREAAKANPEFADEIEKLGRTLAAERIASGRSKRPGRKASEPAIDPSVPAPEHPPYYEPPQAPDDIFDAIGGDV